MALGVACRNSLISQVVNPAQINIPNIYFYTCLLHLGFIISTYLTPKVPLITPSSSTTSRFCSEHLLSYSKAFLTSSSLIKILDTFNLPNLHIGLFSSSTQFIFCIYDPIFRMRYGGDNILNTHDKANLA